jgi:hypothetical protein
MSDSTSHEIREILHTVRVTERLCRRILRHLHLEEVPTSISFQEITMLPPVAGNTLVYTGTLAPAGAVFPSDSVFAVTSSDPTVTPTVDPTGLIVTIPLPSTFVDNPSSPFSVSYTATSASTGMSLSASIVPSIPAVVPTGITFVRTT